jgi:hypothetical protein
MLDLDHVGAQHRQLIGRERAGKNMGDVDDTNAFERSRHCRGLRASNYPLGLSAGSPQV